MGTAAGSYTILDAATVTGAANLAADKRAVPVQWHDLPPTLRRARSSLNLQRKTAAELDLNASETAIFDAALIAADSDLPIAATFPAQTDRAGVRDTLQQLLPEHAGGVFETATKGSRLAAADAWRSEPASRPLAAAGGVGFEQVDRQYVEL